MRNELNPSDFFRGRDREYLAHMSGKHCKKIELGYGLTCIYFYLKVLLWRAFIAEICFQTSLETEFFSGFGILYTEFRIRCSISEEEAIPSLKLSFHHLSSIDR